MSSNDGNSFILTPKSFLSHGLAVGGTGAGKSSRVVYPAIKGLTKLIAAGEPITIVIVDLKGEPWLFHAIRDLVEKLNENREDGEKIPFRWLNPTANRSSYGWNLFNQKFFYEQRRESRVQMLLKALGYDFGDGYGKSFFTGEAADLLRNLFSNYRINSFSHFLALIKHCKNNASWFTKTVEEKSKGIQSAIAQWAQIGFANIGVDDEFFHSDPDGPVPVGYYARDVLEHQIEMSDVITRPQLLYFNLTTTTESSIGPALARAVMWQITTNLKWHEHTPTNKVFFFADEVQSLATQTSGIDHIYTQARQAGMSIFATLQDMNQMENDRLAKVLSKNSGLEVWLDAPPPWRMQTEPFSSCGSQISFADVQHDQTLGVVYVADPSTTKSANPFGKPQMVRFRYAMSLSDYEAFSKAKWPAVEDYPGTMQVVAEEKIGEKPPVQTPNNRLASFPRPTSPLASIPLQNDDDTSTSTDSLVLRFKAAFNEDEFPAVPILDPKLSTTTGRALVADIMGRGEALINELTAPSSNGV